jgi:hypothetical protein
MKFTDEERKNAKFAVFFDKNGDVLGIDAIHEKCKVSDLPASDLTLDNLKEIARDYGDEINVISHTILKVGSKSCYIYIGKKRICVCCG